MINIWRGNLAYASRPSNLVIVWKTWTNQRGILDLGQNINMEGICHFKQQYKFQKGEVVGIPIQTCHRYSLLGGYWVAQMVTMEAGRIIRPIV